MTRKWLAVLVITFIDCGVAAVLIAQRRPSAQITQAVPWAGKGVWLRSETHTHTTFSDGGHSVDEVVDKAVGFGCDVLAITDHTDAKLKAASIEYHAAIAAARARAPRLVVLTGVEWNVPPGKGDDHAALLLPASFDSSSTMQAFKDHFDAFDKKEQNAELAQAAFDWLRATAKGGPLPVMFLNHPSRRAVSVEAVLSQLNRLSQAGKGILVGVEGAPGHQHADPLGAYSRTLKPDDRWDPAIVPSGAAWDRLLGAGLDLSGSLATSDFHSQRNGDYWPCEFSSTWIYAADRTSEAVLNSLRAGTFSGVHGGIARDVSLTVTTEGLQRPAIVGERVRVPAGQEITIQLSATVSPTDWEGKPNHLDHVELLAVDANGTNVLRRAPLDSSGSLHFTFKAPSGAVVLRARGRRIIESGPDLLFYTNGIRIN